MGEEVETKERHAAPRGATELAVRVSDELPRYRGAERFETGRQLGSGGMGEVVLQKDRNIGREIAKKTLHLQCQDDVSIHRFLREARVQGQLEHPSVVPVHDLGFDANGRLFFSMKRVRGETLGAIVEGLAADGPRTETRFTLRKLLHAFVQVCLAVEYAHQRGVLHRDLKPHNVMLGDFGEVYVLDWGIAKLTTSTLGGERARETKADPEGPEATPDVTTDGDLLGTPRYMAPEQLRGKSGRADERADVFALGVILFELLTLEPYRRGTLLEILLASDQGTEDDRPSRRVAGVPAELDALCAAALARDPSQRLTSARALATGVERYLEGDRDLELRRARAAELVKAASARFDMPGAPRDAGTVTATREVLHALALAPDDPDAQRLLVRLVFESSRELSPDAEAAYAAHEVEARQQGLRRGIRGFAIWLCALPFAAVVGVRSWAVLMTLVAVTVACITASALAVRSRRIAESRVFPLVLAAMTATTVSLGSAYLGPFVLPPIAACAASVMFLVHATREEAPGILAIWIGAILLTFGVECSGLLPPAYTFAGGEVVLHPRLLGLPQAPTLVYLAYVSTSFVGILGYFVAQVRSRQREAERKLFGQAWVLQRLFP